MIICISLLIKTNLNIITDKLALIGSPHQNIFHLPFSTTDLFHVVTYNLI